MFAGYLWENAWKQVHYPRTFRPEKLFTLWCQDQHQYMYMCSLVESDWLKSLATVSWSQWCQAFNFTVLNCMYQASILYTFVTYTAWALCRDLPSPGEVQPIETPAASGDFQPGHKIPKHNGCYLWCGIAARYMARQDVIQLQKLIINLDKNVEWEITLRCSGFSCQSKKQFYESKTNCQFSVVCTPVLSYVKQTCQLH